MKVIDLNDIAGTERDVHCPNGGFNSVRFLLAKDGMGFSLHRTFVPRGPAQIWHYKNHLEACYCVSGYAILTNLSNGDRHFITADTMYALDNHDIHSFQAIEDTLLISVFNPPVTGTEVHGKDHSYAVSADE